MVTNFSTFISRALLSLILLMGALTVSKSIAQPIISAKSMSLGGSGTAYLSGPQATFWNPANLVLSSGTQSFHLTVGNSTLAIDPVLSTPSITEQLSNFSDTYLPYEQGAAAITGQQRQDILETRYSNNKLQANYRQQAEILLAGALWQRPNYAFSIALRARYASHTTVGRGWYDENDISKDDQLIRDFSLTQQRDERYELAFGYAQEFTFINGLLSGINKIYIGITPKIILSGSHFNARYNAQYLTEGIDDNRPAFVSDFNLKSTGNYSAAIKNYRKIGDPRQAVEDNLNNPYTFKPTGYGLGFDFGLNYVIPLSTTPNRFNNQLEADKSIRIAFSLNDIGAIQSHDRPLRLLSAQDTAQAQLQSPVNKAFIGAGGQYINYLDQATSLPNPLVSTDQYSEKRYLSLLPTSVNAGILIDLTRVKFTSDLTLGLNNTAFTSNNVAIHLGLEVRPIKKMPLRLGTHFAKEQPLQLGLGTGLETKHWDFTVSCQAMLQSGFSDTSFSGGAFGGLQFHF